MKLSLFSNDNRVKTNRITQIKRDKEASHSVHGVSSRHPRDQHAGDLRNDVNNAHVLHVIVTFHHTMRKKSVFVLLENEVNLSILLRISYIYILLEMIAISILIHLLEVRLN